VDEIKRSMIMLMILVGPIITLLFLLAPPTKTPLIERRASQDDGRNAQQGQPNDTALEGGNRDIGIQSPNKQPNQQSNEANERITFAAEAQARYTKWQAILGVLGAFVGIGLLLLNYFALAHTQIAANAAARGAKAAAMAVEHADRPWVQVYLKPESLTISDGEFVEIRCQVSVKNIGKSVAQQVIIWNQLAVHPNELSAEQEKLRARFDQPQLISTIGGFSLFPDEEKTQIHGVGTGKERPDKYWREMMPVMLERDLADRILPLTYVGCVGYRYGNSDKWHYTYWGYDLVAADGKHLAMHIATGRLPQPPYLSESFLGNLNRAD
jgi:hypothetical protein